MIGKLLNNEGANAAVVVALSGAIAALISNGPGRASLGRMVSGALSNPVPRREASVARFDAGSSAASERRAAA